MKKSTSKTTTVSIEKEVDVKKYYYFLGFLVFFLFANTIGNGYNMDDELVTMNHKLTSRGLEAITDIFTSPYYSDAMGYAYGYRPIVHLSFAIEHQLFGEKAGISHLINVLLFTFSVILFFKLICKWVGEKHTWMALVIAVLFAVHPIHTEAVASIKNRDEILAFMFVILAGLSMQKWISKRMIISIALMFVFFSLAMLSKKSVFPLAFVFPFVAIYKGKSEFKDFLVVSLLFVIPAACVGSDFIMERFLKVVSLFTVALTAVYFIQRQAALDKQFWIRDSFLNRMLSCVFALTIIAYSFYKFESWVLIFVIPCFIWSLFLSKEWAILQISISMILIGIYFDHSLFIFVVIVGNTFLLIDNFKARNIFDVRRFLVIALATISIGFIDDYISAVYVFGFVFLTLFVSVKNSFIGLFFSILLLLVNFYFEHELGIRNSMVVVFALLYVVFKNKNMQPIIVYFTISMFSILLVSKIEQDMAYRLKFGKIESEKIQQASDIKLVEGRKLEFAENTLVAQHSKSEFFGTGMAVLGKYMMILIFPHELSYYYGFSVIETVGLNDFWVWIAIVLHIGLIVLAITQMRKHPLITIGVIWYICSIILFSNWVELVAGMVGERLAFTASAGFCMLLGGIIFWIKPSFSIQKPTWIEWTVVGVVVLFSVKTIQRNAQWKDALTLMTHDIEHLGNSAQANNLLALRLMQTSIEAIDLTAEQRLEMQNRAIVHFDRAIALWPDFMNANFDKGRAAQVVGNHAKAIEGFQEAIRIDSTFHQAYFNLLTSYDQLGQTKQYLQTAKNLFKQNQDPAVYEYLARGYFLNQQKDSSSWILQEGIKKYPSVESLKANLQELRNLR